MTIKDRVAAFLLKNKGKAYCDDCIATEIGINRHLARNATYGLAAFGSRFQRDRGTCTKRPHRRVKKVIQASSSSRTS